MEWTCRVRLLTRLTISNVCWKRLKIPNGNHNLKIKEVAWVDYSALPHWLANNGGRVNISMGYLYCKYTLWNRKWNNIETIHYLCAVKWWERMMKKMYIDDEKGIECKWKWTEGNKEIKIDVYAYHGPMASFLLILVVRQHASHRYQVQVCLIFSFWRTGSEHSNGWQAGWIFNDEPMNLRSWKLIRGRIWIWNLKSHAV